MIRWQQRIETKILARAAGNCEKCHEQCHSLHVIHLDQESSNWRWKNLQAMCSPCFSKHNLEMFERRRTSTSHAVRSWFGRSQ